MVVGVMGNLFVVVVAAAAAVVVVVVAVDNSLPSQLTGQRALLLLLLLLCHLFKLTGLAAKNRTQAPKQTRTQNHRDLERRHFDSTR